MPWLGRDFSVLCFVHGCGVVRGAVGLRIVGVAVLGLRVVRG